jgi:hypothetical protein
MGFLQIFIPLLVVHFCGLSALSKGGITVLTGGCGVGWYFAGYFQGTVDDSPGNPGQERTWPRNRCIGHGHGRRNSD